MHTAALQFVIASVLLLYGGHASQAQDHPVELDPSMNVGIQSFGMSDMLGESSLENPQANQSSPAGRPAPAPKTADQQAELQMAEVEWKDAYDSTVAPGKLKIPIKKSPNASDRTWLRRMVESMKKGEEEEDIKHAKVALTEAQHLMQDSPRDQTKLPDEEDSHLAATIAQQEKDTDNLKAIVKRFTERDPVTQDAQAKLAKSQQQVEDAENKADAAKAQLEARAKEAQDRLMVKSKKDVQQLRELNEAKSQGK